MVAFASSLEGLDEAFAWARDRALAWVQTGSPGVLPSYWAGMVDRPMFYSRDVAHQALGAHLLGLDEENFVMLRHFAASATAARKYYPLWAFLFDGTPAELDYRSDESFVRETPAAFEIAEKALSLYRWTGDVRYATDPAFASYFEHLFDFVALHDVQGLGLAGELQTADIFAGSPTYNEHAGLPDLQIAADGVASQWAAMRSLADVLGSARAAAEADRVLALFESRWWDAEAEHYIVGLTKDGGRARGFSSEASWFPMVKRMPLEPSRLASHVAQLMDFVRDTPPRFVESASYLPEVFLGAGFDAEGLHWLRYLADTRSDYPEISYVVVAGLVVGLTGLEPRDDGVVTRAHIPDDAWVSASDVPVRDAVVSIRHDGEVASTLTSSVPLRWEARFGNGSVQVVDVPAGTPVRLTA
ncbi:hypothetical protein [Tenggerimyces flavus]|uniref:Uncharacterized protein n=1 Tax=Tenggerimyces flavus TaxID=1708749 RepID=A0ABV7YM09_9ACTN|nr:hypothetical protein [Tenggerimyces flavus]MBM7787534.1 hypothetical protein [Tenggerimyces flavus]